MLKRFKQKIFLGLVVFIGLIVLLLCLAARWMRADEPLTEFSKNVIQSDLLYTVKLKQHPYFLFLGLNAKDEIAPEQLGRYRYHREWANFLLDPNESEVTQIDQGWDESMQRPMLNADVRNLLKQFQSKITDRESLELFLKEHEDQLQLLIQQEQIPLLRLQQLIQQDDYVSLVLPSQAINPNYSYILDLQRLSLVDQLLNHASLENYHAQFKQLHRFTQNRLSIIEKMMMQNWMDQIIDVMRMTQKRNPKPVALEALNQDQLSLVSSLEHELGVQYVYLQLLPDSFSSGGKSSTWVFLPNRTFNSVVQNYQVYFDLSNHPYAELQKSFAQPLLEMKPKKWVMKNFYGERIAELKPPSFEKYILMTHMLNNKILAFNAVNAQRLNLAELNQNSEGRHYYIHDSKLCIEIPYALEKIPQLNLKTDSCVAI